MDVLGVDSFAGLLYSCYTTNNYKGCVVLADMTEFREFVNSLRDFIADNAIPGVVDLHIRSGMMPANIYFHNGSMVTIFATPGAIRGHRCNSLLYSDKIQEECARAVFAPMESLGHLQERMWVREYEAHWVSDLTKGMSDVESGMEFSDPSKELDDFLKGFKVVS